MVKKIKYEPCNTKYHEEYWVVNTTSEPVEITHYCGNLSQKDKEFGFYFCTDTLYGDPETPNLCRRCMQKYGLLW